jgi:hypothetical protein
MVGELFAVHFLSAKDFDSQLEPRCLFGSREKWELRRIDEENFGHIQPIWVFELIDSWLLVGNRFPPRKHNLFPVSELHGFKADEISTRDRLQFYPVLNLCLSGFQRDGS